MLNNLSEPLFGWEDYTYKQIMEFKKIYLCYPKFEWNPKFVEN